MKNPNFLISTVTGQIPNIIESSKIESLKRDLVLYLDDFLYKDSLYDAEECEISLKNLCAIDGNKKIILAFRNTPKVLSSKRGNYKLTKEKFLKVLNVMKPDYYFDYTTQKLINFKDKNEIDGKFVDPKTPEEFYELTKDKNTFIGTNFVNELIKNKQMLKFLDNRLIVTEITNCKCCGDLKDGYLAYLLSINEINGFIYLTIHNYNVLYEVFNKSRLP